MIIKKVEFPRDFAVWLHKEAIDHPVEMNGVTNGHLLVMAWASIHVIKSMSRSGANMHAIQLLTSRSTNTAKLSGVTRTYRS
jgi:hypothetical protein